MEDAEDSQIGSKVIGVMIYLSMIPQFALLAAFLPQEAPAAEVVNNAEGAAVFTLQTASQALFSPAVMCLLLVNVGAGSFFLARSRMDSLDAYEKPSCSLAVLGAMFVLPLIFLACLAVCTGVVEPFLKFRSVAVAGQTVTLKSLANEWSLDRATITEVTVCREDRTNYVGEEFWIYYVEIETKSGKSYRSLAVGSFEGNDNAAAKWWQHLNHLKSAIEE